MIWGVPGGSRRRLGVSRRRLEASWTRLEASWRHLAPSWQRLGSEDDTQEALRRPKTAPGGAQDGPKTAPRGIWTGCRPSGSCGDRIGIGMKIALWTGAAPRGGCRRGRLPGRMPAEPAPRKNAGEAGAGKRPPGRMPAKPALASAPPEECRRSRHPTGKSGASPPEGAANGRQKGARRAPRKKSPEQNEICFSH